MVAFIEKPRERSLMENNFPHDIWCLISFETSFRCLSATYVLILLEILFFFYSHFVKSNINLQESRKTRNKQDFLALSLSLSLWLHSGLQNETSFASNQNSINDTKFIDVLDNYQLSKFWLFLWTTNNIFWGSPYIKIYIFEY